MERNCLAHSRSFIKVTKSHDSAGSCHFWSQSCAKCLSRMNPFSPHSDPTKGSPSYQGFLASVGGSLAQSPRTQAICSSPDMSSPNVTGAQVQKEAGPLFSSGTLRRGIRMTDPGKTDSSVIGLLSSWVAPGPLQYRSVRLKEQPLCLLPTGKQTSKMEDEGLHCAPHRVPPALSGDWTTGSLVFLTFSSPTILHCILSVICFHLGCGHCPNSSLLSPWSGKRPQDPVFPAGFPETCLPCAASLPTTDSLARELFIPLAQMLHSALLCSAGSPRTCGGGLGPANGQVCEPSRRGIEAQLLPLLLCDLGQLTSPL